MQEITEEFINNFNKKCAEFLDWKIQDIPASLGDLGWYDSYYYQCEVDLEMFHEDWNFIHKIIEKIDSLGKYSFAIDSHPSYGTSVLIQHAYENGVYDLVVPESVNRNKIDATIIAINQFINWYNSKQ